VAEFIKVEDEFNRRNEDFGWIQELIAGIIGTMAGVVKGSNKVASYVIEKQLYEEKTKAARISQEAEKETTKALRIQMATAMLEPPKIKPKLGVFRGYIAPALIFGAIALAGIMILFKEEK